MLRQAHAAGRHSGCVNGRTCTSGALRGAYPMMVACQWNKSSPAGPALQDVGGSFCRSWVGTAKPEEECSRARQGAGTWDDKPVGNATGFHLKFFLDPL